TILSRDWSSDVCSSDLEDIADHADFGMMNMAANHAIHAASGGLAGHRDLEARDIFDRVLDLVLEEGRERPVRQAQLLARLEKDEIGRAYCRERGAMTRS